MATKKEDIEIKVANDDTRIEKVDQVLPPIALLEKFPASEEAAELVRERKNDYQQGLPSERKRYHFCTWYGKNSV